MRSRPRQEHTARFYFFPFFTRVSSSETMRSGSIFTEESLSAMTITRCLPMAMQSCVARISKGNKSVRAKADKLGRDGCAYSRWRGESVARGDRRQREREVRKPVAAAHPPPRINGAITSISLPRRGQDCSPLLATRQRILKRAADILPAGSVAKFDERANDRISSAGRMSAARCFRISSRFFPGFH